MNKFFISAEFRADSPSAPATALARPRRDPSLGSSVYLAIGSGLNPLDAVDDDDCPSARALVGRIGPPPSNATFKWTAASLEARLEGPLGKLVVERRIVLPVRKVGRGEPERAARQHVLPMI